MSLMSFASDNYAGIHPEILKAIEEANVGHSQAYGNDTYTQAAINLFKSHFGEDCDVYFVCNGTAANVLSINTLIRSYHCVICAESAHINEDECGAPEKYTGCKLLTVPTTDGKIKPDSIKRYLSLSGDQHKVQPKMISISQSTEYGTVYTLDEIKEITSFAHQHGIYVHMDGSRISNAAASLKSSLKATTQEAGIDVLSFGGTKAGMMLGEAVIFFNKQLGADFPFIRKQGMQLISKMRFISVQFTRLLTDDLWLKNARNANEMAKYLATEIRRIPQIKLSREVQANAVFAIVDPTLTALLQKKYHFYVWNEATFEVRWMTSWDTTKQDIDNFISLIKSSLGSS